MTRPAPTLLWTAIITQVASGAQGEQSRIWIAWVMIEMGNRQHHTPLAFPVGTLAQIAVLCPAPLAAPTGPWAATVMNRCLLARRFTASLTDDILSVLDMGEFALGD